MQNQPSPLRELPRRSDVIRAHKAGGGRVAAVFPVHYPRALLRAFDILPVEVWGPPGVDSARGDDHLQAYTCSVVRCGLSFALAGGLDEVDLVLSPHACDSLQGLASVLLDFARPRAEMPVLPLYLPRNAGPSGHTFLAAELRGIYERLAQLCDGRRPSDDELMAAIRREEAADAYLSRLLDSRRALPLDNAGFYKLVRAREYLPAEIFSEHAQACLDAPPADAPRGVPILLSGIVPEPRAVLEAIDRAGGLVVGDDLACSGRRLYPVGHATDPIGRMVERLLGAVPDTTRGDSVAARCEHLLELVSRTKARGAIFFEPKFCEVECFYLPEQRKALEARGVRSIVIEVDVGDALPHQVTTRIEALLETIA